MMEKLDILVLEDDKLAQKVMAVHLAGHDADIAGDLKTALRKIAGGKYDMGFFDLMYAPTELPILILGPSGTGKTALANSLKAALQKVAGEIMARNLRENGGRKTKTLADLRISTRLLYSTLGRLRIGPEEEKE